MIQITRLGFAAAFCVVLLRLAIGYHFFKEGESKIRDGNFTAAPFFSQAKGELAPFFRGMLGDPSGEFRLCYSPRSNTGIDPSETFDYWKEFGEDVAAKCRTVEREIQERRDSNKIEIDRQRANGNEPSGRIAEYEADEQKILALRAHTQSIGSVLRMHMTDFEVLLAVNEEAISEYFLALERENGFERDGPNRAQAVREVDSLYRQRTTVGSDNAKALNELVAQVEESWDALELDLNSVGVSEFHERGPVPLARPYEKTPILGLIDLVVPWHHVIVGCMIFFGLFCRPASIVAALFMAGIAACQLPWAVGAVPTFYQIIEMLALLSLAAVSAGRYAGLDYFIEYFSTKREFLLQGDLNEPNP